MTKIKFKLSKSEVKALVMGCELGCKNGNDFGITHKAAKHLLTRLAIKILSRADNLKDKNNSISISFPEAWAISMQCCGIIEILGPFEQVVMQTIIDEIHRKAA